MIILWFLQVLFLNNFYEVMKKEQTDAVVKNIKKAYKVKNSERFLDNIEEISDTHDIYIYIASFDGSTMYFKPSGDNTSSDITPIRSQRSMKAAGISGGFCFLYHRWDG